MLTLPPFSLFFKAIYLHNSSELEIIRQQTHALFIDTLSERNIKKVTQSKFLIWSDIVLNFSWPGSVGTDSSWYGNKNGITPWRKEGGNEMIDNYRIVFSIVINLFYRQRIQVMMSIGIRYLKS